MKAWEYFLARLAMQESGRTEREHKREAEASVMLVERLCQEFLNAVEHDPNRSRDEALFNAGALRAGSIIIADQLHFSVASKLNDLSDKLLREALGPEAAKVEGEN